MRRNVALCFTLLFSTLAFLHAVPRDQAAQAMFRKVARENT